MSNLRNNFNFSYRGRKDLEDSFLQFLDTNVIEFFSNTAGNVYTVDYLQLLSTTNEGRRDYKGSKHRQLWLRLSDAIGRQQANSKYKNYHMSVTFYDIHLKSGGNYTRLMNLLSKYLESLEDEGYQFNRVKYSFVEGGAI